MQLQGIVFIQLQGNDILVNCKEINSFKGHIFIHKKYNHSRQLYSFTESYSFQGTYQFILGTGYVPLASKNPYYSLFSLNPILRKMSL